MELRPRPNVNASADKLPNITKLYAGPSEAKRIVLALKPSLL